MVHENEKETAMPEDSQRARLLLRVTLSSLRYGWPVFILLGILWFPFDWLSTVWPAFGVPFRQVFRTAHDHFIGHTIFFFIIGILILNNIPVLSRRLHWYILGLVLAALIQETIQASFRGELPTFTDFNAFKGDAVGGMGAWILRFVALLLYTHGQRMRPHGRG
jgi:hypothetical protein